MARKSVVTRERSASSVSAALDTFTPSIQERLVALAAPHVGPGEAMPDWSAALHLLARMLDRSAANIRGADERHEAELRDDDAPREAREAQVTQAAKVSAIAAHDPLFASVANVAEGLLTLVGENDLAQRVRPSARRPGVTASDEASDDTTDGDAPEPKDDAPVA